MKKKLEDYLHLYLGCEAEWGFDGRKKKGFLVGKDERYGWQIFDPSNVIVPYQPCRIELLKPILRPLSDMTDEEAVELCKVFSPEAFGDYRFSKWVATRNEENFCYNVTNDRSDMSFNVDLEKMHIKVYEDGYDTYPGIENHTYFLEYLKMGFDIFGLIESGLAIDKTKIKP